MVEENQAGQGAVLEDKFGKYYNKSYQDFGIDMGIWYAVCSMILYGITLHCTIWEKILVAALVVFAISLHALMIWGRLHDSFQPPLWLLLVILYIWGVYVFLQSPIFKTHITPKLTLDVLGIICYVVFVSGAMIYKWIRTKNLWQVLMGYLCTCWIVLCLLMPYGLVLLLMFPFPFFHLWRLYNAIPEEEGWDTQEVTMEKLYEIMSNNMQWAIGCFVFPLSSAVVMIFYYTKLLALDSVLHAAFYIVMASILPAELIFRAMIDSRMIRIERYY